MAVQAVDTTGGESLYCINQMIATIQHDLTRVRWAIDLRSNYSYRRIGYTRVADYAENQFGPGPRTDTFDTYVVWPH